MWCKINSQTSSRLRQLPLNLKIKKEVVLPLPTTVRGRNGKRQKKEGLTLPNISCQLEVGTLGRGLVLVVPWSTGCVTSPQHTLFRHFFQSACGRHPTPRVAEFGCLLLHICSAPGCTMEKHFLCCFVFCFSFSEWSLENWQSWDTQLSSVCHAWFLLPTC